MQNKLSLFLVNDGEATSATPDTICDGFNSILVLASCNDDALAIAADYDSGILQADNHIIDGVTIAVIKRLTNEN